MIEYKCHRCGSTRLEPGALSPVSVTFRPANTKFLTLRTNDVPVKANMCLDCGMLQLVGDVKKAQALAGQTQTPH